jgi:hypothetical protein
VLLSSQDFDNVGEKAMTLPATPFSALDIVALLEQRKILIALARLHDLVKWR